VKPEAGRCGLVAEMEVVMEKKDCYSRFRDQGNGPVAGDIDRTCTERKEGTH